VKMGEDITETLEVIPRQWKVIQTVREKFTCRECEKISQPPAPPSALASDGDRNAIKTAYLTSGWRRRTAIFPSTGSAFESW